MQKKCGQSLIYQALPTICTHFAKIDEYRQHHQQLMSLSQALKEKLPEYVKRHDKVIFLHDNAHSHIAEPVKVTLEVLYWDILPHPPYSSDIAPSDYHSFKSMARSVTDEHF